MAELFLKERQRKFEKKQQEEEKIRSQIEECDKKIFRKERKRLDKFYNITQTAFILGVHRQSIYYWIKKGWINPQRDYRNYTVLYTRPQNITN